MERCEYNGSVLLQLLACGDLRWLSKACSGRVVPADDPSCLTTSMTYPFSYTLIKTFSPSCVNTYCLENDSACLQTSDRPSNISFVLDRNGLLIDVRLSHLGKILLPSHSAHAIG